MVGKGHLLHQRGTTQCFDTVPGSSPRNSLTRKKEFRVLADGANSPNSTCKRKQKPHCERRH